MKKHHDSPDTDTLNKAGQVDVPTNSDSSILDEVHEHFAPEQGPTDHAITAEEVADFLRSIQEKSVPQMPVSDPEIELSPVPGDDEDLLEPVDLQAGLEAEEQESIPSPEEFVGDQPESGFQKKPRSSFQLKDLRKFFSKKKAEPDLAGATDEDLRLQALKKLTHLVIVIALCVAVPLLLYGYLGQTAVQAEISPEIKALLEGKEDPGLQQALVNYQEVEQKRIQATAGAGGYDPVKDYKATFSVFQPDRFPLVPSRNKVDKSYFDDALFMGNSLCGAFAVSTSLDNATTYFAPGNDLHNFYTNEFDFVGFGSYFGADLLKLKSFKKVYLMYGLNSLAYDQDEMIAYYKQIVEDVREANPGAIIYICAVMPVEASQDTNGRFPNNEQVQAFNAKLFTWCEEESIFYLNLNYALANDQGVLEAGVTADGIHFGPDQVQLLDEYIMTHYVLPETN